MKLEKEIIVMKFGGSSVGDAEKIERVADRVIRVSGSGGGIVVVVSAMGNTTDELLELAGKINKDPSRREIDMLLSTGEQISIALLAMAIQKRGFNCVSFTGNQAGIITDDVYSNAKILTIATGRVLKELKSGKIVVVAGFQGVTQAGDITTLGRGGSDTTAVAMAAALNADYCEIYTDVDGVYTTDPNVMESAKKIVSLSYDEMLELASSGAKVLHLRAVEFAKKHNVVLHVRSSFNDNEGTWVMDNSKKTDRMERPVVTGVTYDTNEAKITIFGLEDLPGIAAKLFGAFAGENINVDLIVQNVSEGGVATISLTIKSEDVIPAKKVIENLKSSIQFSGYNIDPDVAKVSIVGAGMQTHPGVAAAMFDILAKENINIEMISTSPIRISCVIRKEKVKAAVRALHKGFELEK
ncbi:MAG: aspartate kinase [Actinobacteria bacterium]|nr:aspartate kinase [Actinomycetota bacterium]MBM3712179.1 aspartate kinase [Actinomycetota bacterium]